MHIIITLLFKIPMPWNRQLKILKQATTNLLMAMFETSCRFQVSGTVGQQVLVQTKTTTARFDWRLGPPCFWNFGSNKHCLLCSGKNESIQHVLILSLAILDAYKWEATDMTFICFRTKTTIVKFKRKERAQKWLSNFNELNFSQLSIIR